MTSKAIKIIIILIVGIMTSSSLLAQNYSIGDTLNILAINGLNIRTSPGIKSKKLVTAAYAEKVTVLEILGFNKKDTISNRVGNWVKVECNRTIGFHCYIHNNRRCYSGFSFP